MTTRLSFPTLLLAAAALATAACSRPGSDASFEWSSEMQPGAVIHIRDGVGNITVSRAAGATAVVRGSRAWKRHDDVEFKVQQRNGEYYVCAMWRNSGRCDGNYRGRNTNGFLSMFSLF